MKDVFYFDTPLPELGLPLFDSHCHIQFPDFDEDRDEVIARAKEHLEYLVCVGCDLESSKQAIKLAEEYPDFIYATVGNHPYEADKSMEGFEELISSNPQTVVAVGETGLDYFKNELAPEIQKESFRKHCELAKKFNLPIIIHTRETDECYADAKEILLEVGNKKVILHCFAGSLATAQDCWANGWKTSFSLNTTYPKNEELRQIMAACPPELKLIETDSPYLAPQDKRGHRNEPSFI
jgi:TatD DNase family protein